MKKLFVLMIVALFMASCSEQQLYHEFTSEKSVPLNEQKALESVIINSYLEKARRGDGNAFLKLAECYHDGIGVNPDFMSTLTMLMMADQYGVTDSSVEEFLISLPETDNTKLLFEAIANIDRKNMQVTDSIVEVLIARGSSDGFAIKGVIQVERGDTLGGQQFLQTGATMGSSFAELLLSAFPSPETGYGKYLNIDKLKNMSEKSPISNKLLGDIYSGYFFSENGKIDESLAAFYYKKADEQGCLGKRPAKWLINYYIRNDIKVSSEEIERLRTLSDVIDDSDDIISDSTVVDADDDEPDSTNITE